MAPDLMISRPRRLLPLLTLLTALAILTTTIYVPSIPHISRDFAVSVSAVQFTLTAFLITYAASQLILGPLSDAIGRKPVILGGLIICLLASLVCALAPNMAVLTYARMVQGFGACAGVVVSRAVVRDLFDRQKGAQAIAIIGITLSVAPAAAPALGGALEVHFGWHASFLFVAGLSALTLALTWGGLPETNSGRTQRPAMWSHLLSGYAQLVRTPLFWGYALVIAGIFAGIFAFAAGAPVMLIDDLGIAPDTYGLLAAIPTLGTLIGGVLSARLTVRVGIERLILIGSLIYAGSGVLLAILAYSGYFSVASLIGPMTLFTLGYGLALPNALAGAVNIFPAYAGAGAALTGFLQMACGSLGTLAVLSAPRTGPGPLTLVIAVAGVGGLLGWMLLGFGRQPPPE